MRSRKYEDFWGFWPISENWLTFPRIWRCHVIPNFLIHMCTKFHENRTSSFRENQYFSEFSLALGAVRHAPCAIRRAPCAVRRAHCLISPVLLIVSSSNFIFKTFLGPGIWIFHFRSDSPDRKSTLQRSQNLKSALFVRV